jgi:hypothetical protein
MSKRKRKRHLPWSSNPPVERAACGLVEPPSWSFNPAEVTCIACARTLKMADAEMAWRLSPDRRSSEQPV